MTDEFCWPPSTITKVQRAALEKLADGRWHFLHGFATNTRSSLLTRGLIANRGDWSVEYRITDAGRMMLNAERLEAQS